VTMTVVVTRDVEARYRGFLCSCMLEVAAGCYVSPGMGAGVRERIWEVVKNWHGSLGRGTIILLWPRKQSVGGLGMQVLGEPLKELVDFGGVLLVRK
jgi:CRISPR-associated protein Cas2